MTATEIKTLREALGLTRRELAIKLDVAEATVGRWESGERTPAYHSAKMLKRLARKVENHVG